MKDFFQKRSTKFRNSYLTANRKSNSFSLIRGLIFIGCVVLLITYFRTEHWPVLLAFGASAGAFYLLVLHHRKLLSVATYFHELTTINTNEAKRLNLHLQDFDAGETFLHEDHPYQGDLDIFGKSSLYQLLNRCQLEDSKKLLSAWLSEKATFSEIKNRQEAVKELSGQPDWCQHFRAITNIEVKKKEKNQPHVTPQEIITWAKKSSRFSMPRIWVTTSILLTLLMLGLLSLVLLDKITYHILYAPALVNGIFLGLTVRHLNELIKGIDKSYYLIATYQKSIELIEQSGFTSQKLKELHKNLVEGKRTANQSILKLANLTHRLSSRANMLYILADLPFLLDAYLLIDLYKWKQANQAHIEEWFQTIHEMECLISLAGFAHANPGYTFPEIVEQPFHFEAEKLGHPLIHPDQKVRNDYSISGQGQVDIITGSNMSGKSTFQRTAGINMVLAQAGAPVDAENLSMSLTSIFTSMRTKDNLAENTSSFYAELKRIRQLLEALDTNPATFFLLDEILKGTNSEDRHNGAMALAKKLTGKPAFGMISTHDLALGELEKTEKKIRNFSFNSTIAGEEIIFDYKLTSGPCKSFNASKLMEKMGIM